MIQRITYELCDTVTLEIEYRAFPNDLNPDDIFVEIDAVLYEGVDIKCIVECLDSYSMGAIESQAIKHYLDTNDFLLDYSSDEE